VAGERELERAAEANAVVQCGDDWLGHGLQSPKRAVPKLGECYDLLGIRTERRRTTTTGEHDSLDVGAALALLESAIDFAHGVAVDHVERRALEGDSRYGLLDDDTYERAHALLPFVDVFRTTRVTCRRCGASEVPAMPVRLQDLPDRLDCGATLGA
jgi:hypothetical protein